MHMKTALIGRSELLYQTAQLLLEQGYQIPLIITAKEAPEHQVTSDDFRKLATSIGARFLHTPKINKTTIQDQMDDIGAIPLAVSVNYTGIISQEVIDLFPIGILNAHGGDLPKYRGNACQAWAIINGEDRIGLCIHKMVGGELDSGDIIARSYYPVDINTRVGMVYDWMQGEIPELMLASVRKLAQDSDDVLEHQSKHPSDALRCYPRRPEDGRINWHKRSDEILRLINASSEPFSGAFCEFNNQRLVIWRAELYEDNERYLAMPGQVAQRDEGSLIVITGQGKLKLTEIESGGKRCAPSEIVSSLRTRFE